MTTFTAIIRVHRPCTCNAARWFLCEPQCPGREEIAAFDCPGYEEAPSVPTAESVRYVRELYPKDTLIHLD